MINDLDIYRSARIWVELHGDEAVSRGEHMIEQMRERGDVGGVDAWHRIIAAIGELRRLGAGEGEPIH